MALLMTAPMTWPAGVGACRWGEPSRLKTAESFGSRKGQNGEMHAPQEC